MYKESKGIHSVELYNRITPWGKKRTSIHEAVYLIE